MADAGPGRATVAGLVAGGVLDAELAALVWLLCDGGVPLVVGGSTEAMRAEVASGLLGIDPARPWVLLDAAEQPPTLDELSALLRGGTAVGLSVAGGDLGAIVAGLEGSTMRLPDDAVRRLGMVLVVAPTDAGPRIVAAHYLRPTERDGAGHLQRRPPAVLATWDPPSDTHEHFAWGVTPELGDRVDRAQADLEERQHDRAAFISRAVTARAFVPAQLEPLVRDYLASEPPRVPAPRHPAAQPSPFSGGLIDPEPHHH